MNFEEYIITGSTSFIGSNLVNFLIKNKKKVTVLVRNKKKLSNYSWNKKVKVFKFDLKNKSFEILKFKKKSILIHLAWDFLPNYESINHIENVFNSYRLISNLKKNGVKDFFVAGTCFEYGFVKGAVGVKTECKPTNLYAFSKHMLHTMLLVDKNNSEINLKWGRVFYPYGEGQKSGIIASLEKAILDKEKKFNMSSGNQIKDFVEINSVVNQIYNILHKKRNGTFNICSGEGIKVIDLVRKWIKFRKSDIKVNRGYLKIKNEEKNNFWGVK